MDYSKNRCVWFSKYEMPCNKNDSSYIQALEDLYHKECFLIQKDWQSITLSIANQKYTFIPYLLFNKKDMGAYLQAACGIDDHDEILYFTHTLAKLSLVFAENASVIDWFRACYSGDNFHVIHQSNAIIQGIQLEYPKLTKVLFFVWLEEYYMHIVVCDKDRLWCYNSFVYETIQDVLNCLENLLQVLDVPRKKRKLVVGGLIEHYSKAYSCLKKCMPDFELKTDINFLGKSMKLVQRIGHNMAYFDLLSSFFCNPYGPYLKY